MGKMIGYCGVDCTKCVPFIAKQENNDELRRQYAEEQSKVFDMTIDPETINCDGCLSTGELLGHCSVCEIRRCCMEKKLENCAFCDDYVCEELQKAYTFMCEVFGKGINGVAEANITLDGIRKNR
jgi:hypothetical protein